MQTLHSFIRTEYSFANGFLYGITLLEFIPANLFNWSCFTKANEYCAYINGIVQLESYSNSFQMLKRKIKYSLIERLNLFGVYAVVPTAFTFHLIYLYGLHWAAPCKPSVVFYFLIPECRSNQFVEQFWDVPIKILIFLLNHWAWIFSMAIIQYVVGVIIVLCALSFRDFLYVFDQMPKFNSDIDEQMYRKIQVLNGLCNEVQHGAPMFFIMFYGVLVNAVSMVGLALIPWNKENVFPLTCFVLLLVYSVLFLLVFLGGMGNIFQYSKRLIGKRRVLGLKMGGNIKDCRKRKFYVSCQPVKFRFGELNFVDRLTPLNCTVLANRITLQLLILGGKRLRDGF